MLESMVIGRARAPAEPSVGARKKAQQELRPPNFRTPSIYFEFRYSDFELSKQRRDFAEERGKLGRHVC